MDCPNCNFINMPSLKQCARCGTRLVFNDVDISPPRAHHSAIPLNVRHSTYLLHARLRDDAAASFLRARTFLRSSAPPLALIASIVPGGGQYVMKQRAFAAAIFSIWCTALLLTLCMLGSGWVWLFYSILVSLHCLSYTLLFNRTLEKYTLQRRMAFGLVLYGLLTACFYWPASVLIHRIVNPIELTGIARNTTLSEDDVIWASGPWLKPDLKRGDLVVRTISSSMGPVRVLQDGIAIDRLLGIPGDTVSFEGGALLCNGQRLSPEFLPLNLISGSNFEVSLATGEYFVIPTTLHISQRGNAIGQATILTLAKITRQEITGKVLLRTRPFSHIGPVFTPSAPSPVPELDSPSRQTEPTE